MERKKHSEKPDWILLGDGSQYEFLSWMLPPETDFQDLNTHTVWVRSGRTFRMEKQNMGVVFTTPVLPPHILILLPPDREPELAPSGPYDTRYAVFEENPLKDSTLELCRWLSRQNAAYQVVLMDLSRRYASSDLQSPAQALQAAQKEYAAQGIPCQTVRDGEGIFPVLHWRRPLADYWRRDLCGRLHKLCEVLSVLQYDYQYLLEDWEAEDGLLSVEVLTKLCSAETIRYGCQKTIWGCFAERGMQLLFPPQMVGGLAPVVGLYQDAIRNTGLAFLPLEQDCELLWNRMKQAAETEIRQVAANIKDRAKPSPFQEKTYMELVANSQSPCYGIDVAFKAHFLNFVKKEPLKVCKSILEMRYHQLKKHLGEEEKQ